jgi:hypothetical protein
MLSTSRSTEQALARRARSSGSYCLLIGEFAHGTVPSSFCCIGPLDDPWFCDGPIGQHGPNRPSTAQALAVGCQQRLGPIGLPRCERAFDRECDPIRRSDYFSRCQRANDRDGEYPGRQSDLPRCEWTNRRDIAIVRILFGVCCSIRQQCATSFQRQDDRADAAIAGWSIPIPRRERPQRGSEPIEFGPYSIPGLQRQNDRLDVLVWLFE